MERNFVVTITTPDDRGRWFGCYAKMTITEDELAVMTPEQVRDFFLVPAVVDAWQQLRAKVRP